MTGFSAVRGSWKIIAISSPWIARISSAGSFSRSWPLNSTSPVICAWSLLMRPMTVRNDTLLPEPDSPTTPSVSPRATEKETPSTAFTRPSSVGKLTCRSLTSRSCSGTGSPALRLRALLLRVERVAQPVTEEVHTQHDDQDREAREPHEPGRDEHLALRRVQEVPPRRRRRLDPEPEEREHRLRQDRGGHGKRDVHDDRPHRVRDQVGHDDPPVRAPRGARGLDELLLLEGEEHPSHDARVRHPEEQT